MFNQVTTFKAPRPGRPAWGIDAAANDNRRGAVPRSDRPRLVCRWSLPEAGGRPVCRWEVEGADDADPRLREASGQRPGPLHKTVLQLSYQSSGSGPGRARHTQPLRRPATAERRQVLHARH